ncbi:MAG TPA: T9SS type A sorting domain-containing protein [Candidatus Cloacimonadota bacterium]|nr:T9SS type A sorting domain-containing protein [Candidatus Cloacimonadota bacterium]
MKNLLAFISLIFVVNLSATIINIPDDQPTIQAGLNIAAEGDSVIVAEGIYYENIWWTQTNGIKLIGTDKENCIIDGNGTGSVIGYECWEIVHDSTNVIKNFTIQNGYSSQGAGIYLRSENQFILENLIVKDNCQHGIPNFDFTENGRYSIEGGGGIFLDNRSSPIIRNVEVIDNYSEFDGAGLFTYEHSQPILINVLIADNYTCTSGAGIACECWSDISLTNVTIANNVAAENGGGVYIYGGANNFLQSVNSIFWNNLPEEIHFDIAGSNNSAVTISYSDVEEGEAGIITNGYGIVNWLDGNIDDDPLFEDSASGNYHLDELSPCIDAGDPASPLDPDGTMADMGAFYFDQSIGIEEMEIPTNKFSLSNFPNPFNPSTTITFSIDPNEPYELTIYNIKGEKVKQLVSDQVSAGQHTVIWNGEDDSGKLVSSGIYFYKLKVGNQESIKRMLLLK